MQDLFYLCYKSEMSDTQDRAVADTQVANILDAARRHNSSARVTGCLLFTHDYFFQILEGSEKDVKTTFARISKDTRHKNIEVLSQGALDMRRFPESWMGFSEHAVSEEALFGEIGEAIADADGNLTYSEAMVVLSNIAHLMDPSSDQRATATG